MAERARPQKLIVAGKQVKSCMRRKRMKIGKDVAIVGRGSSDVMWEPLAICVGCYRIQFPRLRKPDDRELGSPKYSSHRSCVQV